MISINLPKNLTFGMKLLYGIFAVSVIVVIVCVIIFSRNTYLAKSMNQYLKDQKSNLKAYNNENIPLETLCRDYVSHDIPVMIWATTDMDEPYVFDTWTVNYVDENAKTKIGDSFSWYMHEHCLVLIGYDSKNYYFADSSAGKISVFEKNLVNERYKFFGCKSIVVK